MSDLPISSAASLNHSTIATGDLLPIVDISAASGSKASKITVAELTMTVNGTLLGASNIFTASGAASSPALALTGSVFTGGNSTTTKPLFLVEPQGTTSTAWSTDGTLLGINAPSGHGGPFADFQLNGTSKFKFLPAGSISISSSIPGEGDTFVGSDRANILKLGQPGYAIPDQTISAADDSGNVGPNLILSGGYGDTIIGKVMIANGTSFQLGEGFVSDPAISSATGYLIVHDNSGTAIKLLAVPA